MFQIARPLGLHYNHYASPSVRGQLVKILIIIFITSSEFNAYQMWVN